MTYSASLDGNPLIAYGARAFIRIEFIVGFASKPPRNTCGPAQESASLHHDSLHTSIRPIIAGLARNFRIVFVTCGLQRPRYGLSQDSGVTHREESINVRLTISLARQFRIIASSFINIFSLQVSEPRLNSPSRNEDGNPILFCPDRNSAQTARSIERP